MTTKHPTNWVCSESNYYFNIRLNEHSTIQLEKSLDSEKLRQNAVNAKLIAQAPALLAALLDAVKVIKSEYPESQWDDYGVSRFEEVIIKATQ